MAEPITFESNDALASAVKKKYPQYESWDNAKLASSVLTKYPNNYRVKSGSPKGMISSSSDVSKFKQSASDLGKQASGFFGGLSEDAAKRARQSAQEFHDPNGSFLHKVDRAFDTFGSTAAEMAFDTLGGMTDPKNAGVAALGLVDPLIPAAYFGTHAIHDIYKTATNKDLPTDEKVKGIGEAAITGLLSAEGARSRTKIQTKEAETFNKKSESLYTLGLKPGDVKEVREGADPEVKSARAAKSMRNFAASKKIEDLGAAWGSDKSLHQTISREIERIKPEVDNLVKQADASGATLDVSREIDMARIQAKRASASMGQTATMNAIDRFIEGVKNPLDPATNKISARDLTKLKPSEALALTRYLDDFVYEGQGKSALAGLQKDIRAKISQGIGSQLGDIGEKINKLRDHESGLITAREATVERLKKTATDAKSEAKSLYSVKGASAFAIAATTIFALKAAGLNYMMAAVPVLATVWMARSTTSRTLRAALYAKAGRMLDDAVEGRTAKPASPSQAPSPRPTAPPSAPAGALSASPTPTAPAVPTTGQNAPQAVLSAPSAKMGQPPTPTPSNAPNVPQTPANAPVAQPATPPPTGPTAPPAGSSPGLSAVANAFMQHIDPLVEKITNPKSTPLEIANAKKVLDQTKKIIVDEQQHNLSPEERKLLLERAGARERQARKRSKDSALALPSGEGATAKSAAEGAPTATAGAASLAVDPSGTPEAYMIGVERGYEMLKKMSPTEGPEYVKNFKKVAQDLKYSPQQQFEQVLEGVRALKEFYESQKKGGD